jgi:energy-coupling factor transporter ATP-binding protein EcfA2
MRLLRVRVTNYGGVEECEVRFAPTGVTIVQGPNEIGKSSLLEAVDVIFDHLDSTAKREVKEIKPVHRDAGTEIEVDVETGPYAFTYFKRFHKDRETRLRVERPQPESLTAREAHDRVCQILEETLDVDLWKALRIEQGTQVLQADLSHQRSLSAALERAAGGSAPGQQEETILDAVRQEYRRYYTDTGRERKELDEARRAREQAGEEVDSAQRELENLEADVERSTRLASELEAWGPRISELKADTNARAAHWEEVSKLSQALVALRDRCKAEEEAQKNAKREEQEREALATSLKGAEATYARRREDHQASVPALEDAKRACEGKVKDLAGATDAAEAAADAVKLRRGDVDLLRDQLDLAQFRERKARADAALEAVRKAEKSLTESRINDERLAQIQDAHLKLERTRAQREAGGPTVEIEALADIAVELDDEPVSLSHGTSTQRNVVDSLAVTFPRLARLEVRAGTSLEAHDQAVAQAQGRLRALCTEAGVETPEAAVEANDRRRESERTLRQQRDLLRDNLRDLTAQELEQKIERAERRIHAYPQERPSEPPLPADLSTAKRLLEEAEVAAAGAQRGVEEARRGHELSREHRDRLQKNHVEASVHLNLAEKEDERAREKLERARREFSDAVLRQRHEETTAKARQARVQLEQAEKRLAASDPESAELLARNARRALEGAEEEMRKLRDEQIEVNARLKDRGQDGLSERLDQARTNLHHRLQHLVALRRRAAAARLLHDTMLAARDAARRAYVAPLRERIEKLGRYVFGDSFAISMSDDLAIEARTLHGRTVPFRRLSTGAKEQLSLISRLACAMIVAEDGGVPVILDDALGNTDPQRQAEMSAVLAVTGRECQIIILTCTPDRYLYVGDAQRVTLA